MYKKEQLANPKAESSLFAKERHAGQKYDGQDYYEAHIVPVAEKAGEIASEQNKEKSIITAYLHDVVEDTTTAVEEIEKHFGKDVATAVELLTNRTVDGVKKDKDYYYREISKNEIAKVAKAADRYVNVANLRKLENAEKKEKLTNKYKSEMKYFEKYNIYPELLKVLL